ncbi:helix-turn-helix transcriptional regulator [Phormidium sp. CCY1219]|uniref:helix-turn-helix transcriptional regulator n=1 Tax=Phormidium sp. CCY1219 TaxID=2886104 RepID=UPI002D1EA6EC|nr:WYL domain-containing protein [Phormidium sp. CCY1219]MEB3827393.1 WYL domain-containing protein [Phormidium sp. CCY1219]
MSVRYSPIGLALYMLKLLAQQQRKRAELVDLVAEYLEGSDRNISDVQQKCDRTLRELRDCGFEIHCAPHRPYTLLESNFPLILSAAQREALQQGGQFLADMGFSAQAQLLVRLSEQSESQGAAKIRGDFFPPADYGSPHLRRILAELQDRCDGQRRFTIRYIDSQKRDRTWDLDRCEVRSHDGALYLFAFVPDSSTSSYPEPVYKNRLFRIDRIQSVGPASAQTWMRSAFPTLTIRYRMTGPLATYEPRRSHERVITRNLPEGYVEIETVEDYPFWFRQRIFRYGSHARVLSPPHVVEEISNELQRAARNYQNPGH